MPCLHATWTPEGRFFLWTNTTNVEAAIATELPALQGSGETVHRYLATPGAGIKRTRTRGQLMSVADALPLLVSLENEADVTDSVQCWSAAAKLALELAASQRVVPHVGDGQARWKVQFSRQVDVDRFEAIVRSLPTCSRAVPIREKGRGAIRLLPSGLAVRSFVDSIVDAIYRQGHHPGSSRGWVRELADGLRGADPSFSPRDARFQGIPEMLRAWADEAEASGLRLGIALMLPEDKEGTRFPLKLRLHPPGDWESGVPISKAWGAGPSLEINEKTWGHPAHAVVRGLARASRIFEPLGGALKGTQPRDQIWDAETTWAFIGSGAGALKDAGLEVHLPDAFATAGTQRIRARMRIEAAVDEHGRLDLDNALRFRWEVTLGNMLLSGSDFAELVSLKRPIVRFRGEWVLLDPVELARLPDGLPQEGDLPAAVALRAVLTGEHEGTPVVADNRLELLIRALQNPPDEDPPEALTATLRPYQEKGFSWLTALGRLGLGACLADDMGLGKTVQLITHVLHRRDQAGGRASLVVCPTSVLGNWQRELKRFAPTLKVVRYYGLHRVTTDFESADVVLTTYGLLVRDHETLTDFSWDVIALDEAQAIKNPDSQRARAARQLTARHRVAMSGTPVENRLDELWSLMQFLVPGLLGTRGGFRRKVAIPVERFGDQVIAKRLKRGVSPFLLRRVKTDPNVISDLPDKIEQEDFVPLTNEQAALYKLVVEKSMDQISSSDEIERRGHVLAMLTALKQVCNHPSHYLGTVDDDLTDRSGKLERTVDLLDQIMETGHFCLIFTQYREMGNRLQRHISDTFGEFVPFLHGGTPTKKRDEMVRVFQEDKDAAPVLIISLRAGGTGLNLTRASHVIHYDRWWNPAVEDQATDRAYRIGQSQTVQVHKLVCQGTLEERIASLLEEKRALAESIVGSGERLVTELDDAALRQLVALGDDAVMDA